MDALRKSVGEGEAAASAGKKKPAASVKPEAAKAAGKKGIALVKPTTKRKSA
jgi:hypothetical protein